MDDAGKAESSRGPPADTVEALRFRAALSAMSVDELARRRLALDGAYRAAGDPTARLYLALALSTDRAGSDELTRAMRLLDLHVAQPDAPAGELAAYMREVVTRRAGLAAELSACRADERAAREALRAELGAATAALAAERGRRRELERQLEALKNIERQINQRATPPSLEP